MTTLIVDGNNAAHRARYSYQLSNKGVDTSVTYGMLRILLSVISEVKPESVLVCFDGGTPGFRKRLEPKYKANRSHTDDNTYLDFVRQLDELIEVLPLFGMMVVRRAGIEADDLMFHASRMLADSVILTNDDDLLQAINDNTRVLKPGMGGKKSIMVDVAGVERITGFPHNTAFLAKLMIGDSSDNLPGCAGIGAKTAARLLQNVSLPSIDRCSGLSYDVLHLNGLPVQTVNRLEEFFVTVYPRLYTVSYLGNDIMGARQALISAAWLPYAKPKVYQYLFKNAFVSLVDMNLSQTVGALRQPVFNTSGKRFPRVWDYVRYPV